MDTANTINKEEKKPYSFLKNLKQMTPVFIKPKFLLKEFSDPISIWYGLIPFLFYILLAEITWLTAYFGGYYQPISPMLK